MSKLFIIGLPRTGTTSVCASLLELGFKTAHTAYTQHSIECADAIADTPVFCDYPQLDQRFPGSKFVYLDREPSLWLPSISGLLNRMLKNINNDHGGFNPILKRCFKTVFAPFDQEHINNHTYLRDCYLQHQQQVHKYFKERPDDLLSLNISEPDSYQQLLEFLSLDADNNQQFPHLNRHQKIIAWNAIKHPLKISANLAGPHGRKFFNYS